MAVKIRLTRIGAKKQPSYRIVVKEARSKRDGSYLENIGFYNPLTSPTTVTVNKPRFDWWMAHGAQPTQIVNKLVLGIKIKRPARQPKKATSASDQPVPKETPVATTDQGTAEEQAPKIPQE